MSYQSLANPTQYQAITSDSHRLLMIAGPGSGKTFTLVEKVVYLVTQRNVLPESLMVVTFTEKAAQELRTRVSNRLAELDISFNLNEMYLGTFHSICLRLLEDYREFTRLRRNYAIYDQFDQQYLLYRKIREFEEIEGIHEIIGKPESTSWSKAERLLHWLNKLTEENIDTQALAASNDAYLIALAKAFEHYQSILSSENAMDFSTIQREALQLLEGYPKALKDLRGRISHVMVDEYQDTNTIQELILERLVQDDLNLTVVGDDDQGLYRFRGATIRNILEFPSTLGRNQCEQVRLETNYRSHPDIIRFYNDWMTSKEWEVNDITYRYDKRIVPPEGLENDKASVLKVCAEPHQEWDEQVYQFLNKLKQDGQLTDWNQVAFLFNSVKSDKVQKLAKLLEGKGIPVYSPRADLFFDRDEVRLMLGALAFLFPQLPAIRSEALPQGVHLKIWDYIDQECLTAFIAELRKPENKDMLEWCRAKAAMHLNIVKPLDYAFSGLFYELLQFPVFSRYFKEDDSGKVILEREARNLATISTLIVKFEYLHRVAVFGEGINKDLRFFFNNFLRFLKRGGIGEYEDNSEYAPSGHVSFLTIHQSKGLEFPVVMVGSLWNSPRKQYTDLDERLQDYYHKPPYEPLESTKWFDFWRLYYTAFSRAQNLLCLTCHEVEGRGRTPSAHFETIYEHTPHWDHEAIDLASYHLDSVKAVNLKYEYSFTSHISVFETCARQYQFFKHLEFTPVRTNATLFGVLVHQTIEDIHKAYLRDEGNKVNAPQIENWFEANYHALSKAEGTYLGQSAQIAALNHVKRYFERERGQTLSRVKEAEVDVSLVKPDYILKGTVDLIRGEDDTVEIIDFKASKKPDLDRERDTIDNYRRQLEVYSHIVEEKTGLQVSKMHLYYTGEDNGNPYVSFPKNPQKIEYTVEAFDAVVDKIESQAFGIAERPTKTCNACDLRHHCDRR